MKALSTLPLAKALNRLKKSLKAIDGGVFFISQKGVKDSFFTNPVGAQLLQDPSV